MNHKVSVCIPAFNREDTITNCLSSVARQTLSPAEIIVVDDGSTDGTKDAIHTWISENRDSGVEVVYIYQANQGKSVALNTAFEAAVGEWIAFNDSDDLWLPTKLEKQFTVLATYPDAKVCFSDSRFINDPSRKRTNFEIRGFRPDPEQPPVIRKPHLSLARDPNGFFMQTLVAHRKCAERVFPLDPELRVSQDIDLLFRLSLQTDFCFVSEPLVEIDRTPERSEGLTKQFHMKSLYRLKTRERIIQNWLTIDTRSAREAAPDLKRLLARSRHRIGTALKSNGQFAEANKYLRAALWTDLTIRNVARYVVSKVVK